MAVSAPRRSLEAAYRVMSGRVRAGQVRMVLFHETHGVFLGYKFETEVQKSGRRRERPFLYWSKDYNAVPGEIIGAVSFVDRDERDMYLQKSVSAIIPSHTMRASLIVPDGLQPGEFIMPPNVIAEAILPRYLMKLMEDQFFNPSVDLAKPIEGDPFSDS